MSRIHNWPEYLHAHLEDSEGAPFIWGQHDCCTFAFDPVRTMTGVDLMSDYRDKYSSALSAARLLKAMGGLEVAMATACEAAGFTEHPSVFLAKRGDLLIHDTGHGPAAGLCVGSMGAFAAHRGLSLIPLSACRRAWSTF